MKKSLTLLFILGLAMPSFAKMVKFSVDMDTLTINATGVHVFGDFQAAAGFPGGDWQSNTTLLTQEVGTSIYSVVVDIPAFAKYEYKFINGDQSYEVEFVPDPARVGYNFDDNRWMYVDSLANDTTDPGAVLFSGNAPVGRTLMRFLVDMQYAAVSPSGVHVSGDFQGWDPAGTILYSFGGSVYEVIAYGSAGPHAYRFVNGSLAADTESVPSPCAVNGNREVIASGDTVLDVVCFATCAACPTAVQDLSGGSTWQLFPNPARETVNIQAADNRPYRLEIFDMTGRSRWKREEIQGAVQIGTSGFAPGMYLVLKQSPFQPAQTLRLVID